MPLLRWLGLAAALLAAIAIIRISWALKVRFMLAWIRLRVAADRGRGHEAAMEVGRTGGSVERCNRPSRRSGKAQDRRDRDLVRSGGGARPAGSRWFRARDQGSRRQDGWP